MPSAVCPGGQCAAERCGQLVYRAARHLAASFVAGLSQVLAGKLGVRALGD